MVHIFQPFSAFAQHVSALIRAWIVTRFRRYTFHQRFVGNTKDSSSVVITSDAIKLFKNQHCKFIDFVSSMKKYKYLVRHTPRCVLITTQVV